MSKAPRKHLSFLSPADLQLAREGRKTQTRKLVIEHTLSNGVPHYRDRWEPGRPLKELTSKQCPYAQPGDRILAQEVTEDHPALHLEITGVHFEQLQAITERDATAHGFSPFTRDCKIPHFERKWDERHQGVPHASWADNPLVWVITFKVIEATTI